MRQFLSRYTKLFSRLSYMALGASLVVPSLIFAIICLAVAIIFDAATFHLSKPVTQKKTAAGFHGADPRW